MVNFSRRVRAEHPAHVLFAVLWNQSWHDDCYNVNWSLILRQHTHGQNTTWINQIIQVTESPAMQKSTKYAVIVWSSSYCSRTESVTALICSGLNRTEPDTGYLHLLACCSVTYISRNAAYVHLPFDVITYTYLPNIKSRPAIAGNPRCKNIVQRKVCI